MRDRGAKAGGPRRYRDGQDDFPRVNLRLQCPHPGTEVNRPNCSAIDVLPLSQRLSPYVLEYSFAFQLLSLVSYFHRVKLYLCCLLGIPVSYIYIVTQQGIQYLLFFRTCWRWFKLYTDGKFHPILYFKDKMECLKIKMNLINDIAWCYHWRCTMAKGFKHLTQMLDQQCFLTSRK